MTHQSWKGAAAKPPAIHNWLKRHKLIYKPEYCEECNKKKKLELSSKTHEYTRNLDEYRYLCRSCHMKYDFKKEFRIPHEQSEEWKKKQSEFMTGENNPNYNVHKYGKNNPNYKHGGYCRNDVK